MYLVLALAPSYTGSDRGRIDSELDQLKEVKCHALQSLNFSNLGQRTSADPCASYRAKISSVLIVFCLRWIEGHLCMLQGGIAIANAPLQLSMRLAATETASLGRKLEAASPVKFVSPSTPSALGQKKLQALRLNRSTLPNLSFRVASGRQKVWQGARE